MSTCDRCGEIRGDGEHTCAPSEGSELRATRTDTPSSAVRRSSRKQASRARASRQTAQVNTPAQELAAPPFSSAPASSRPSGSSHPPAAFSPAPALPVDLEVVPAEEGFDPMIGTLLGDKYRIIERLGAGGMGTVYLVAHVHLKKKFAAKILNADTAERADSLARFQQEAIAASRLDHDNIVNIVNFGHSDDGTVFLIMEFLRGEPLNQILAKGRLGVEDALRIGIPVCRGLGAAHGAGIVHRDLKPENVFVSRRSGGRHAVKLLDFGISKIKEPHLVDRRLTQTGDVLGSPLYMSPEASRGDLDVDHRADIYAVGVMLFEMCTGQVPFTADNYLQILYKHIQEPPPSARALVPELPEALDAIILRALSKDPAERFQTCEELEATLLALAPDIDLEAPVSAASPFVSTSIDQPLLSSSPGPAGATPVATPRSLRAPILPEPPVAGVEPASRPRASSAGIVAGFVGTLGILGFGAYALWQARAGVDEPSPMEPVSVTAPVPAPVAVPPPIPMPAAAPPPPRPVEAMRPELTVHTTPEGARVILEGRLLGETPLTVAVEPETAEQQLRVELPGYKPELRTLVFDRSHAVEISLRRAARTVRKPPALDIKEGR